MNKKNKDIYTKFDLFISLLNGEKEINESNMVLTDKKNNPFWLIVSTDVNHLESSISIDFTVERCLREEKYGIKLKNKELTNEPFFRFDSSGPAHRNNYDDVPLEEQQISTPHFNTFDKNGRPWAYKNKALINKVSAALIKTDISTGVRMFCVESNIHPKSGVYPHIEDKSFETNFNHIKF